MLGMSFAGVVMILEAWGELQLVGGLVSRLSGEWGEVSDFLDDPEGDLDGQGERRRTGFFMKEMTMGKFPMDEDPANDDQQDNRLERDVTARRTLEQASHLIASVESLVAHHEDLTLAFDDVWHARELIRSLKMSAPSSGEQVMVGGENVTLRRLLEQARQCVDEAKSVVEHREDVQCASDDLAVADQLLWTVQRRLRP